MEKDNKPNSMFFTANSKPLKQFLLIAFVVIPFFAAVAQNQIKIDSIQQKINQFNKQTGNLNTLAGYHYQIARLFDYSTQAAEVTQHLTASLKIYNALKLNKNIAAVYKEMALLYAEQRQKDSAFYYLGQFYNTIKNNNNPHQLADFYITSARVAGDYFNDTLAQNNSYRKAQNQLVLLNIDPPDTTILLTAINYFQAIANSYWIRKNWPMAKFYFKKELETINRIEKLTPYSSVLAEKKWNAYTFIIRYLVSADKIDEADTFIKMGLTDFESKNDHFYYAKLLWSTESTFWRFSYYLKAFEYQQLELDAWEKTGNKYWKCQTIENMGLVYGRLNNFEKQLEINKRLLKTAQTDSVKVFILYAFKDLAKNYYQLNKPDSAQLYLTKAIELNSRINNIFIQMVLYYIQGLVYEKNNQPELAIEPLLKAIEIRQKYLYPLNTHDRVAAENALARIYLQLQKYPESYQYATQSLILAETENVKEIIRDDCHTLAMYWKIKQNPQKSLEYFERYSKLKDDLALEDISKAIQRTEIENIIKKARLERKILEQDINIKSGQLKQQKYISYSVIAGLILLIAWFVVVFKSYNRKKRDNKLLAAQKAEIQEKNEELFQMNEDLHQKNEEITTQRDEIETQRDEISRQLTLLARQQKDITDSIVYASRIQHAMLPSNDIITTCFPESFIIYKPKNIVSGDFYWAKQTGNVVYIAAADCTGHGVPGAFMSMLGISLLNDIVGTHNYIYPAAILKELRTRIKKSLNQKGRQDDTKDGMDIAFVMIDKDFNQLNFSGAYNPLYLFRKQNNPEKPYELTILNADRMPIGIHPKDTNDFTNHQIEIFENDRIYIFSDGIIDQFGGDYGDKFKSTRLKDTLFKLMDENMENQKKLFLEQFSQWQKNFDQLDDILFTGIKITF